MNERDVEELIREMRARPTVEHVPPGKSLIDDVDEPEQCDRCRLREHNFILAVLVAEAAELKRAIQLCDECLADIRVIADLKGVEMESFDKDETDPDPFSGEDQSVD
jgi:hypothetical protein